MTTDTASIPDWDIEQLEVILEEAASWQLVEAGPGAGKSAVACQRLAYLVDEGIPPSRMLLVSFTRTAVAELRDRIVEYAVAGERAKSVRISTIDSHAWSLHVNFNEDPLPKALGEDSFDLSIERTVDLFRQGQPELLDFMGRWEHVIIDEAQDVTGLRADLVIEMLGSLAETCGVTILADPAQAIYGFTTDDGERDRTESSLLARLQGECPRELLSRGLKKIHRIKNTKLVDLFLRSRKEVERTDTAPGYVERIQNIIRETCCEDMGDATYSSIADFLTNSDETSMLVLFRRRADVLITSSYCSGADIQHRLRLSDVPTVVRPWIGWLFAEVGKGIMSRDEFESLWQTRKAIAPEPFAGEERNSCWERLHRLCAGTRTSTVDLVQLRRLVARARPPVELCYPDLGRTGPILGTIHASKGREADTVVLVMPLNRDGNGVYNRGGGNSALVFEEGRVFYVGATRARKTLVAAGNEPKRVGYLDSNRVYRSIRGNSAQLEVGRNGDVDRLAHLNWSKRHEVQIALARACGASTALIARSSRENDYVPRLILQQDGADGIKREIEIGQMSEAFQYDLRKLWSRVDSRGNLRPHQTIPHIHLVAVTTVGLTDEQLDAAGSPFNVSGLALAPVVKGFPLVKFDYRRGKGSTQ